MSRSDNPYYDGGDPQFFDYSPKEQPLVAARIYDYIDGDGEMLTVTVVDEEFLAVSVQRRGQTAVLRAIIGETEEARKISHALIEWADAVDEARDA